MNVKISYTVPFEEVPSKVQSLLNHNRNKLEEAAEIVNQIVVENDTVMKSIKNIDHVRKLLLRIDNQLADCYSILYGYNKALVEAMQPAQEEEVNNAVNMDSNVQEG